MDQTDGPSDRWQAVLRLRRGAAVTALTVMQVLGFMVAGHPVDPLGLLHMHCLQRWFTSLHSDPKSLLMGTPLG